MSVNATVWKALLRRASLLPDALLVIDSASDRHLTYEQTVLAAERLAAGLLGLGISMGSKVAWQLPTGLDAFLVTLALARLGSVQMPIISLYRETEVRSVLARGQAEFYLVPSDGERDFAAMAQNIREALNLSYQTVVLGEALPQGDPAILPPPPEDADAVRWIYTTSGTTSEPKGARHTDRTLLIAGRNLAGAMKATSADIGSIAYPIAHVGGVMYMIMLLYTGASVVLLPRFVVAEAVAIYRRYGVTLAGGSTAHYMALLGEQRKQPDEQLIPSMRLLAGGGAPKPPELYYRVVEEVRCAVAHGYGMTECPLMASGRPSDSAEQLANSEGAPVCDVEVKIVRSDGSRAEKGESGEIRIRGAGVFKGYTDPALNAEAFDEQGYFRTGDLGVLRTDGYLAITGRLKDLIIRKGENISAKEIEDLLFSHPKIGAVAVIGLPDAERGERVCAVVELAAQVDPLSFEEMVTHLNSAGIMRQKIPEQLELVERLPRNETLNKVLKYVLREQYS